MLCNAWLDQGWSKSAKSWIDVGQAWTVSSAELGDRELVVTIIDAGLNDVPTVPSCYLLVGFAKTLGSRAASRACWMCENLTRNLLTGRGIDGIDIPNA